MGLAQILIQLAAIPVPPMLPEPPTGTAAELVQKGLDFFGLWISRIGGMVAFVGAVKFAIAVKADDARDQVQAVMIMVSGFMIQAAIADLSVFQLSKTNAEAVFTSVTGFIARWVRRVGALTAMIGGVMFGFSVKEESPAAKVNGLRTFAAGAICMSVSAVLPLFV